MVLGLVLEKDGRLCLSSLLIFYFLYFNTFIIFFNPYNSTY